MDKQLYENILKDIERHEGYRRYPYRDTVGKLTVGIGRNLDDVGIRHSEALALASSDIRAVVDVLDVYLPHRLQYNWQQAPLSVQRALVNMAFQMGVSGLLGFKRMFYHLLLGNYHEAADEALDSKWAQQTPERAREVAGWIREAGKLSA